MTEETILEALEKMEKAVEHVQVQFTTVRTGRATPALVERLLVEYYGSTVPLQQLAGFQVPEARQLLIKPHDGGAATPGNGTMVALAAGSRGESFYGGYFRDLDGNKLAVFTLV